MSKENPNQEAIDFIEEQIATIEQAIGVLEKMILNNPKATAAQKRKARREVAQFKKDAERLRAQRKAMKGPGGTA